MSKLGVLLAIAASVALLGDGCASAPPRASAAGEKRVLYYRSSMDPSFVATKPGKDAMGMDLVPVREGDPGADLEGILVDGVTIQRMGVRVAPVVRASLVRTVRAVGTIDVDETRVAEVSMKFDGWIEKLWVNETGQRVKLGAPLFAVYSPELLAGEQEYLQTLGAVVPGTGISDALVRSARQRLLQFDVPQAFIDHITRTQTAERRVIIGAPASGVVVHKTAFKGTFVKKGTSLFTIAELDTLWVMASVFESDAPWIEVGQQATVTLDYLPGRPLMAKVDYVYPTLDRSSRTVRVRLVLDKPPGALKPGMFATVRVHTQPVGDVLVVPDEAVLHGGDRDVVFVQTGKGRFEPRDVTLGVAGDDGYEVLSGLKAGEFAVVSGQFLLDSESNLKSAVRKMLTGNAAAAPPAAPATAGEMSMPMEGGGEHAAPPH